MFDFIHKNKRIVQIVLALLAVPFALWGVDSYTRFRGGRDAGREIAGRISALVKADADAGDTAADT